MLRRSFSTAARMATYTTDKASPFTRAVIASMRRLYPEDLADKSFDNTGLLLEAPFDPIRRQMNSVLLTIDLTKAVADEAIERKDCVVVAYHPIIFKGLKSLTLADTQQQSLLRLALEGISVYSPHTAVDAAPGGLGDWLADIVTGTLPNPEPETHTEDVTKEEIHPKPIDPPPPEKDESSGNNKPPQRPTMLQRTYSKPTYPQPSQSSNKVPTAASSSSTPKNEQTADNLPLTLSSIPHKRRTIHPSSSPSAPESPGMGRHITFSQPQPLTHLIERIARGVGSPKGFPVAIPQTRSIENIYIRTAAVCAGSGHDVLRDVEDADLWFTGELSHHQALAATERGKCVVTLFHSNTERGFLSSVMKGKLEEVLKEEWERVRGEERSKEARKSGKEGGEEGKEGVEGEEEEEEQQQQPDDEGWREAWEDALADESVLVEVSERDRDPFGIVVLQSGQEGQPL